MNGTKLYIIAKGGFRASVIVINHIYYLSYLTWIVLLYPLKVCGFQYIFYKLEGKMMYSMIRMIAMWSQWAGYEVLEAGDDITECLSERTLVLVNHQSAGDVLMLFNAFITRSEILAHTMWIMDNILKYSTFGLVCLIRRDFFIFQGKEMREKSLQTLSKHIQDTYLPLKRNWLVLFPEGGFLYKRRKNSQKYGQKNNLPILEHVTIPRVGALQVIMDGLNPKRTPLNNNSESENTHPQNLKYILDITIGYTNAHPVDVLAVLFGNLPPCKTTVFYRLYPIKEVPQEKEDLSQWLLNRWVEKEKMLDTFYKTGEFPLQSNSKRPTLVRQNIPSYLALHIAFLMSTFFHYRLITLTYHYCCSYLVR